MDFNCRKMSCSNFFFNKPLTIFFHLNPNPLAVKRRLEREAKAIIEGSLHSCSPHKKRNVGIYENLMGADQAQHRMDSKLSRFQDEDFDDDDEPNPSAPLLHSEENKSNSSMTTAEANESYFSNRRLPSAARSIGQAEEEFTFTDSALDQLAYNA